MAPATADLVLAKRAELIAASGAAAFHHIFCGPLRKRWVYTYADGVSGPRSSGCGYQPAWRRLETTELVNVKHFRDASGAALPDGLSTPRATDCLWGMDFPGQALLFTAYPTGAFDEDYVFVRGRRLEQAATAIPFTPPHSSHPHCC